MAGSKSNYLENEMLDHVIGNSSFSAPATLYAAAFTTAFAEDGSMTEVSGGNYSRVAITNNLTNWPAASGGAKSNANDISFPQASASWGTIQSVALFDAATGGNMLYGGDLAASKAIGSGDTFVIAAGDFDITED